MDQDEYFLSSIIGTHFEEALEKLYEIGKLNTNKWPYFCANLLSYQVGILIKMSFWCFHCINWFYSFHSDVLFFHKIFVSVLV